MRRETCVRVARYAHAQRCAMSVPAEQEARGERLSEAIVRERHAPRGNAYGPNDALGGVFGRRTRVC